MENYITVGSFPIKVVWLAILGSVLVAYGVLALKLKNEDDKKQLSEVLSNAIVMFWFIWKFSYAVLHPFLIFKHPLNLLYFNGGETGIIVGMIIAVLYLLCAAGKRHLERSRLFYCGVLGLTLFFTVFYGAHYFSDTLLSDGLITLFFAVLSIYLYILGAFQPKKTVVSILVTALFFAVVTNGPFSDKKSDTAAIETAASGLNPGNHAPDFRLQTLDGKTIKLSDLKGKVVLLNFWATWCPPCRAEMPEMVRFYNERSSEKIEILAVNLTDSDTVGNVKKFTKDYKLPFPVLLDSAGTVGDIYKTVTIPTTFVIDAKGTIKEKHIGPMSYDMMTEFVNAAR
ncbi:redoxin domain-containing protein [Bacillus sp. NEB1478]|uniref:redoxin domain-containing protein n=1 Tax=Bacillus sp. NEB1478 TaxID=3073816 RepID=UPI0028732998|nr:redoxin domain-containing protein [Bacillus sp. NEB1478]WNB92805.1 redoxin domain-containing protein [Bacillus sp. NEB1478]